MHIKRFLQWAMPTRQVYSGLRNHIVNWNLLMWNMRTAMQKRPVTYQHFSFLWSSSKRKMSLFGWSSIRPSKILYLIFKQKIRSFQSQKERWKEQFILAWVVFGKDMVMSLLNPTVKAALGFAIKKLATQLQKVHLFLSESSRLSSKIYWRYVTL